LALRSSTSALLLSWPRPILPNNRSPQAYYHDPSLHWVRRLLLRDWV